MGEKQKKLVLVTGAAGGIGRSLALEFAAEGHDIVAVDRSDNELGKLAADIASKHPSAQTHLIPMDLSEAQAAEKLHATCAERGFKVDVLVNNVGFGKLGEHVKQELEVMEDMLSLNNLLLTKLCLLFGQEMKERRSGEILNVASLVGFSSSPFFSAYSGTKAYVIAFSVGIAKELRQFGVQVSCLCPGTTKTGFLDTAEIEDPTSRGARNFVSAFIATPDVVAKAGVQGLRKKKEIIVPTLFLRFQSYALRVLPIELMAGFVHRKIMKAEPGDAS